MLAAHISPSVFGIILSFLRRSKSVKGVDADCEKAFGSLQTLSWFQGQRARDFLDSGHVAWSVRPDHRLSGIDSQISSGRASRNECSECAL